MSIGSIAQQNVTWYHPNLIKSGENESCLKLKKHHVVKHQLFQVRQVTDVTDVNLRGPGPSPWPLLFFGPGQAVMTATGNKF